MTNIKFIIELRITYFTVDEDQEERRGGGEEEMKGIEWDHPMEVV